MKLLNLILITCLFFWGHQSFSKEVAPKGEKLVRFVCELYSLDQDKLLNDVIIIDQLSTKTLLAPEDWLSALQTLLVLLGSTKTLPGDWLDEITGEMMVDRSVNISGSGRVQARLRLYSNVSLYHYIKSNVSLYHYVKGVGDPFDKNSEPVIKRENFDQILEELLKTTSNKTDELGRIMDYSGTMSRTFKSEVDFLHGDPGPEPKNPRNVKFSLGRQITAYINAGFYGIGDYYLCGNPIFFDTTQ